MVASLIDGGSSKYWELERRLRLDATGLVWGNHLQEVGRLLMMKDFESDDCNFENYPLFYGQPVVFG